MVAVVASAVALEVTSGAAGASADCAVFLGIDRSGSQNDPSIAKDHLAAAEDVIDSRSDGCVVVLESINDEVGSSIVSTHSLVGEGDSPLLRNSDADERREQAIRALGEVFESDVSDATNILDFLSAVEDHLKALPLSSHGDVRVWIFSDAVHQTPTFDMLHADLSDTGIDSALEERHVPDCRDWTINFVGAGRSADGALPSELTRGVRRFWQRYAAACGADVGVYDTHYIA